MQYQLSELFESIVDRVPDREALICSGRRLTYAQLDARANQLAHHLRDAGIGRGDHVGVHLMNSTEYVETMLACQKISAVPVNVNYRYVEEELAYLYDNANLAGLVFDADFADRVMHVAPKIDTFRHFIVVGDTEGGQVPEGTVAYDDALASGSPERDFEGRSPDDLWILYTGGTTGMPKGVMWRHEDLFFAGMGGGSPVTEPVKTPEELAERIDPDAFQMTMFAAAPLMHGAAELAVYIGFWAGNRIVLIRKYGGDGALQLIAEEKINTMSIVGDAMALPLIEALEQKDYDTSSLGIISTAGAIMSGAIRGRLKELMPNSYILDSFGSSETGYNGMATDDSSPDTGLKFRMTDRTAVVTDDLRVAEPGSDDVGRVAQKGHVPLGYYGDEKKTAETFPTIGGDRWVLTGDYANVDAEGIIHVHGRGSVCINSGGEKIYPEEVEAALKAHPAILDCIVAGIPDDRWGQRVSAVMQVRPGHQAPSQEDIENHLSTRVARYKIPRLLVAVDTVVRSPAGKPDYKWAQRTAAEAAGVGS